MGDFFNQFFCFRKLLKDSYQIMDGYTVIEDIFDDNPRVDEEYIEDPTNYRPSYYSEPLSERTGRQLTKYRDPPPFRPMQSYRGYTNELSSTQHNPYASPETRGLAPFLPKKKQNSGCFFCKLNRVMDLNFFFIVLLLLVIIFLLIHRGHS